MKINIQEEAQNLLQNLSEGLMERTKGYFDYPFTVSDINKTQQWLRDYTSKIAKCESINDII